MQSYVTGRDHPRPAREAAVDPARSGAATERERQDHLQVGDRGVHLDKDTTSIPRLTFAQPIQPEGWITRKGGMRPVEG